MCKDQCVTAALGSGDEEKSILPIAPPSLPKDHHNRRMSCAAALRSNVLAGAIPADLIEAATYEGWSREELIEALETLSQSEAKRT